jgi:thiamine kinase-like enzyme
MSQTSDGFQSTVQVVDKSVIKSSTTESILGELFFFSRTPDDIADLFPTVSSLDHVLATQSFSVTMSRVDGITFSHLLVSRALTPGRFDRCLAALKRIHDSNGVCSNPRTAAASLEERFKAKGETEKRPANIYANYHDKLVERYQKFKSYYEDISDDHAEIAARLTKFLNDYEACKRARPAKVIHGDPVFSNILLTPKNTVVYIDVRGRQGDVLTM